MSAQTAHLEAPDELAEETLTPWQRVWRNLASNWLAMAGGIFLVFFFFVAIFGWWSTSSHDAIKESPAFRWLFRTGILLEKPYLDPSVVRLPDRLRPPLSRPATVDIPPENMPRLGIYVFGTDELGRDVFARMLEGSKIALAVGFVAVGISVFLGILLGGIAGFYLDIQIGAAPILGALAGLGAGALLSPYAGALPVLGAGAGGIIGWVIGARETRWLFTSCLLGGLLGLAISPAAPAPGTAADWWLSVPAGVLIAIAGILWGVCGEEEAPGALLLAAFTGGVIAYGVARFLEPEPITLAAITLVGAVLLAAIVQWKGADRLLHRMRFVRVDTIFITLVDVQLSFPVFFLILTIIAILPPSIWNIMVVIGLTGWVGPARFVRAEILSLRERPFLEAATALGADDRRLIFLHLVPNALAPVLVSATIGIASAILTEAALSFLGFGVPPPDATWGNILSDGKKYLFDAPWLTFIPGFAILIVVLAFNLFGEGLRDAMNPRAKPE